MASDDITALPPVDRQLSHTTTLQDPADMPYQKIPDIKKWHTRATSLDTDVMVICPAHPEFMVTGTYNLVRNHEQHLYPGQFRHGSIFVLPVDPFWQPEFPGNKPPVLAKKKLPAAILDIHFHPADATLLAVAVSDMNIHFFRFAKRGDILSRRVITELIPLGFIKVAERIDGILVFPTQFRWLDVLTQVGNPDRYTNYLIVHLAATLSAGEVIIVKAKLSGIKSTFDPRLSRLPETIPLSRETVHYHDLEAWTVMAVPIDTTQDRQKLLLLSGADDSKLKTSIIEINTSHQIDEHTLSPPASLWTDSKSHSAGVTAILPLPSILPVATAPQPIPLLTGSYDEHLRLFTLSPHTHRRAPLAALTELHLHGGVWRIKLMDHYIVPLRRVTPPHPNTPPTDPRQLPAAPPLPAHETHYVLIVASMHNGPQIVRVTHVPSPLKPEGTWTLEVAARLQFEAHKSLVYDVEARKEWLGLPVIPYPDSSNREFEFPGKTTKDVFCKEWMVYLEEVMAKRKMMPLEVKTDVKWKDALLGEIAEPEESEDVEQPVQHVEEAQGTKSQRKKNKKAKGNNKKGKDRFKARRPEKPESEDTGEDEETDEQPEEDVKEVEKAMEDLSTMTAYEKEQYELGVGKYTCLSVGFYDFKLNTWEWTDTKRREGVGMLEFLEEA
jgi:hypothetical protein